MKMRYLLVFCLVSSILIGQKNAYNDKAKEHQEGLSNAKNAAAEANENDKNKQRRAIDGQPNNANNGAHEKPLKTRSLDLGSYGKMMTYNSPRTDGNYMNWNYDSDNSNMLPFDKDFNRNPANIYDNPSPYKQDFSGRRPDTSFLDSYNNFDKGHYSASLGVNYGSNMEPLENHQHIRNNFLDVPDSYDYGSRYRYLGPYSGQQSNDKNLQSRPIDMSPYGNMALPLRNDAMGKAAYASATDTEKKEISRRSAIYEKMFNERGVDAQPFAMNNMLATQKDINRLSVGSALGSPNTAYYDRRRSTNQLSEDGQNYANEGPYQKQMNRRSFQPNSYINTQKNVQTSYGKEFSNPNMAQDKDIERRSYDPNFYLKMEPFGKDAHRSPFHSSPLNNVHAPLRKDIDRRGATSHGISYANISPHSARSNVAPPNKELQRRYVMTNKHANLVDNGPFAMVAAINCEEKKTASTCGGSGGGGGKIDLGKGDPKQKGANIALKAANDAKAAKEAQIPAGEAAAQQVRQQLAERAMQAAQAAEAALAGKQQIVQQLEQEVREAEAVTQEQATSLQNAQSNIESAKQAAVDAEQQLTTLRSAVDTAKAHVSDAEAAAAGAEQSLSEKGQLLEAAKTRVEVLLRQLSSSRQDFEKTKQAAYKAVCAAAEAKSKVNRMRRMLRRRHSRYLRQLAKNEEQQSLQQQQQQKPQ